MTFISQADDNRVPATPQSVMDHCPELVSLETFTELKNNFERIYYEGAITTQDNPMLVTHCYILEKIQI